MYTVHTTTSSVVLVVVVIVVVVVVVVVVAHCSKSLIFHRVFNMMTPKTLFFDVAEEHDPGRRS